MESGIYKVLHNTVLAMKWIAEHSNYSITCLTFLSIPIVDASTTMTCAIDSSPLNFTWQQQCPVVAPTFPFADGLAAKNLEELNRDYLIYHNWPLSHIQIFGLGASHNDPLNLDLPHIHNAQTFAQTVEKHAGLKDHVFYEGISSEVDMPCTMLAELSKKEEYVIRLPIQCHGWEILEVYNKAMFLFSAILQQHNKLEKQRKKLMESGETLHREQNELFSNGPPDPKKMAFFMQRNAKRENQVARYFKKLTFFNSVQAKEDDLIIRQRNRGIKQVIDNALKNYPKERYWIKAGSLHFFPKNSMVRYEASSPIAELRDYFTMLESQGHPVALLYPRQDSFANTYRKDLNKKKFKSKS